MFVTRLLSHKRNAFVVRFVSAVSSTSVQHDNTLSEECETKLLKVAIVGTPNAGKSTLINALMDRKVCAASSKVHTTRAMAKAVFTEDDTQVIFIDTPGLVHYKEVNKYKLDKAFVRDAKTTLKEADVIGVVHDVSNIHTREQLDAKLLKLLESNLTKPSFLVLNKIDLLKSKRKLLDLTRTLTAARLRGVLMPNVQQPVQGTGSSRGWPHFSEIFMISALTCNGLRELRDHLLAQARPGEWPYPADTWSDQSSERIVLDAVRAQLLNYMQQEIPYSCTPIVEFFETDATGKIRCVVLVRCPSERIARLIAGVGDGRLRQIIENVQKDLQNAFQNFVMVNIILEGPKS